MLVHELVAIGQEASVAAAYARPLLFLASCWVDMDDPERLSRYPGDGIVVGLQPTQHSRATFGRLYEQHSPAVLFVGQQLAGQFGVL